MRRYKVRVVPWNKDTADSRGFFRFAREHYREALKLAFEVAEEFCGSEKIDPCIVGMVFDKVASPLVYLYDAWEVLPSEDKAKYDPEFKRIHEEAEKLAQEIFPKDEGG